MDTEHGETSLPNHSCQVFRADEIVVTSGANLGDGLDMVDEACAGDVYRLRGDATPLGLALIRAIREGDRGDPVAAGIMEIAPGSPLGRGGDRMRFCARLTLMAANGDRVELLALRHMPAQAQEHRAGALFVLPLSPMAVRTDYTLLQIEENIDADPEPVRLSDILCVSLGLGTNITLPDGRQMPIERLSVGDKVLTRDHGPQPVRWIGRATLRAVGSFAPVVITAGAMENSGDLVVSQHHRMFIYQRRHSAVAGTSELLVQAKHLVDGARIFFRAGGFMDYYSLVFDRHEIIYAENIPSESLLVNEATLARLPQALAEKVRAQFPGLSHDQHFGTEASRRLLDAIGRDSLLTQQGRTRG